MTEYVNRPIDAAGSHLVVKRGHHGRFRFALIASDCRLTGEIRVDVDGSREAVEARALAGIADLATELANQVARRSATLSVERTGGEDLNRPSAFAPRRRSEGTVVDLERGCHG